MASADKVRFRWHSALSAYSASRRAKFDWQKELPTAPEARQRFEEMGISFPQTVPRGIPDFKFLKYPSNTWKEAFSNTKLLKAYVELVGQTLSSIGKPSEYPLLAGYSDFVVVPAEKLTRFAHFCGVFAAANMFAEIAVPTALALACDRVRTELPMGVHFADRGASPSPGVQWKGIEFWEEEIPAFCQPLGYSWAAFMEQFPEKALYYPR